MYGTVCRRCGSTAVHWARTENGRPMMMDDDPDPYGNVVVSEATRQGELIVHVLTKIERETDTRQRLTAHAAYCGKERPHHDAPPVIRQETLL